MSSGTRRPASTDGGQRSHRGQIVGDDDRGRQVVCIEQRTRGLVAILLGVPTGHHLDVPLQAPIAHGVLCRRSGAALPAPAMWATALGW
jgi:hypothetical protein